MKKPKPYYAVPNGFTFTICYTMVEAKRLARKNTSESLQWFDRFVRSSNNAPGLYPMGRIPLRVFGR